MVSSNIVLWHIVLIVFFVDVHFAVFPLGLNDYAASVSFEREFTLGFPCRRIVHKMQVAQVGYPMTLFFLTLLHFEGMEYEETGISVVP